MNWDSVQGKWTQYKGKAKERWGEFTDDELDQMEGKRDRVVGKLQEKYGYSKEEAERHADEFGRSLDEAA